MMKRSFGTVMLALMLMLCPAANLSAGVFKESWYMSRGKANMEIKNYKAAIEAFEKLVEINPDNHEAMRLLGRAYEAQGLTDKAIEHYDRHLNRFPDDADIAFKQARYLEASRFSYRRKDAIRYYRMGLSVKPHHENRHRLSKLLAAERETIGAAVDQYKILIKNKPGDQNLKAEYRKVLLWDDRYLNEAIKAFEEAARDYPNQFKIQHQLAKLYYKDSESTQKAIRQYRQLVNRHPGNVNLRIEYAKALAKSDAHFDQATEQFKIALKKKSDYGTRLAYADHLAAEAYTFEDALVQYERLLQTKPGDADVRLKYARLLGAHFESNDQAIEQYQILLDRDSENSTLHRELAAAFAWRGDNDRAIYHSKLALRYDSQDRTAGRIRDDLMQGREPRVWAGVTYVNQSGDESDYDYDGFLVRAGGKADITPFVTAGAEIGLENYSNDDIDVDGTFYKVSLQGRFDPLRRVDAEWKYHDFDDANGDSEFLVQYTTQRGDWKITPGIRREFKYDSLLAIAGDTDPATEQKIGAARSNTAFCKFFYQGEQIQGSVKPYLGYVDADSTDDNTLYGADADIRFQFKDDGIFAFSTLYKLQVFHYDEDSSGFADTNTEPFAGGYFSPDLFVNNVLLLEFRYQVQQDNELRLNVGPSVQYKSEHSDEEEWHMGVEVDLSYDMKISPSLLLTTEGSYYQIADVYRRFALTALISYTF